MTKKGLPLAAIGLAAIGLAAIGLAAALVSAAGCEQDRDAKGNPEIKIRTDRVPPNVTRELRQAGREVKSAAREVGREVKQGVRQGARQIDEKVSPAVRGVLDDAAVTTRVKAKLLAAPNVAGLRVTVETVDGQVTLSGTAASEEERVTAEKLARETQGVKSVVNQIQLTAAGAAPRA